jgi:hypothetical protein
MDIITYPFKVLSSPFKKFFQNQIIQLAKDNVEFRGALRGPPGPPGLKGTDDHNLVRAGRFFDFLPSSEGVFELEFDPPFETTDPILTITATDFESTYTILEMDRYSAWIQAKNFIPIAVSDWNNTGIPNTINADWGLSESIATPMISSAKHNGKIWTIFSNNGFLSLSQSQDTTGQYWNEDTTWDFDIETATRPFLLLVDKILHIFYIDTEDDNLYWMNATDMTATDFSNPVQILGNPIKTYTATSITQNGLASPAILASQPGEGDYLIYTRLNNEPQPSWVQTNIGIFLGNKDYYHFSLCDVAGEPAFSLQGEDNSLYYYRSLEGQQFENYYSTILDDGGNSGAGNCLAVCNGFPVISYYNFEDEDEVTVRCVTSTDSLGYNDWNLPVQLNGSDSTNQTLIANGSTFVSEFFGRIIVCYYMEGGFTQQQALDQNGNQWFDPFDLTNSDNTDIFGTCSIQMSDFNQCPVIIYSDVIEEDTRLVTNYTFPIPLVAFNWLATEYTESPP